MAFGHFHATSGILLIFSLFGNSA